MCNYLYYWVTVRNSQSYWHLEHMGETLACTGGGAVGGGRGPIGRMGGRGNTEGWVKVWGSVCVCVCVCVAGVRSGISFDISRCYCIVFLLLLGLFVFFLNLLSFLLPKALVFTFIIFLGYEGIIKNNTSCCECTSNNQTSIVLLCHNVQFIYLYIYSGKKKRRKRKEKK